MMDSSISEAFYGVYTSSKEIIKNGQTHLYCNMLELLKNTCCRTSSLSTAKIQQEDLANFWLEDILPLVFDKDEKVQKNAIDAFEQYLSMFDVSIWHSFSIWTTVRTTILNDYVPEIHKLRNEQNKYWHKIWCLLVRLFNCEILKGAHVINCFLAIVEQGFRSSANKVRTECYSCWHLLIHIFHTHGELTTPKRMKLVCIPLKTGSTRNQYPKFNIVKLHVWWYLITCLGNKLSEYVTTALEPFLGFSLMILEHCPANALWPLLCLTALVSENMDKQLLEDSGLESLSMPSPLLEMKILKQNSNLLIKSELKAFEFCLMNTTIKEEQKQNILQKLIVFLHKAMSLSKENFNSIAADLHKHLSKYPKLYEFSLNTLAENSEYLKTIMIEHTDIAAGAHTMIDLYTKAKDIVSKKCANNFISSVFKIDNLCDVDIVWRQIYILFGDLFRILNDEKINDVQVKILIYQGVSTNLPKIIKNQKTSIPSAHITRLSSWILWPFKLHNEQKANGIDILCDANFVDVWSQVFKISSSSGNKTLLSSVGEVITDLIFFDVTKQNEVFVYFEIYKNVILEMANDKNLCNRRELLIHINTIVGSPKIEQTVMERCLKCSTKIFANFKQNEILILFDDIKTMLSSIVKQLNKFKDIKEIIDTWKGTILEKLRTTVDKQKFAQIKTLFKDDLFVIIPSVWSLNPEKLTDRQKERFTEKLDNIPELYNDMPTSTHQSPMKPWTPTKVVIACNDQTEISLEGCTANETGRSEETHILDFAILENAAKNEVTTTTPPMNRNRTTEQCRNSPTQPTNSPLKTNARNDVKNRISEEQTSQNTPADETLQILERNENSPKKNIPTFVLSSPPDRKCTNNSRSPTLRPKSTSHMTGRGAQLINMIRSRSIDVSRATSPFNTNITQNKDDTFEFSSPSQPKTLSSLGREQTPTTPSMELLIFSKTLPPPSASPSASILKKRLAQRDIEEIDCQDLPASKRKRVSFHDPPVSVTKQYVREVEEIKGKIKR